VTATILRPEDARALVPELASTRNPNVWVYRFEDAGHGWTLSIATHAEPGSGKLSLGGFRIAPLSRTSSPGFTTDREAIALAMGMEEKVHWSRVIRVGGPLAMRDITRIVGGKCVMAPTADARVGQPNDAALLDFAVACFRQVEADAGIHITTGQDLGHGVMHDGTTSSLAYLNARFAGSVVADTSVPTGEGNYQLLRGMLRAAGAPVEGATVGLVGLPPCVKSESTISPAHRRPLGQQRLPGLRAAQNILLQLRHRLGVARRQRRREGRHGRVERLHGPEPDAARTGRAAPPTPRRASPRPPTWPRTAPGRCAAPPPPHHERPDAHRQLAQPRLRRAWRWRSR
jgi:hypothetical protein